MGRTSPNRRPRTAASPRPPTTRELIATYDGAQELTLGLEEEILLADPQSFELTGRAPAVLEATDIPEIKLELPASQLEIVTPVARTVGAAAAVLARARRLITEQAGGLARGIGAGVHPNAARESELNAGERYDEIRRRYAVVAARQVVCALQVHVAVRGAQRALAVYNALRCYLPQIAALAANAPFEGGRDSGLASVRPTITTMLPRQGVPPPLASWDEFASDLSWGASSGTVPEPRQWWWELRPNAAFGTLEVRVADTQITTRDGAAVAAFVHSLVGWLAERHDDGQPLPSAPTWRIAENRWSACRDGVEGELADLQTGARRPTRQLLEATLELLAPTATRLGCDLELASAAELAVRNGSLRQREIARQAGIDQLPAWLAEQFAS